jgi:Uma2 family endonuclease
MGVAAIAKTSLADYLELEEKAGERHEYFGGDVYAMAGGTGTHATLCSRTSQVIGGAVDAKGLGCRTYNSDMKIFIEEDYAAVYPDFSALCGAPEYYDKKELLLLNPSMVVEVLSQTTMARDLGAKLKLYQLIPSLQEILYIWSDQVLAQRHFRAGAFWATETYHAPGALIALQSLGISITLDSLYGPLTKELPWATDQEESAKKEK